MVQKCENCMNVTQTLVAVRAGLLPPDQKEPRLEGCSRGLWDRKELSKNLNSKEETELDLDQQIEMRIQEIAENCIDFLKG